MAESSVLLKDFLKVVGEVFPSQPGIATGEGEYGNCLKRRELWDNLANIEMKDVQEIVLPFLNKWQCRLSYKCAAGLTEALQSIEPMVKLFRGLKIESADLLRRIRFQGEEVDAFMLIQKLFDTVSKVKAGRRTVAFTATSKILHMVLPDFFVMADAEIRKMYGCEANGAGYANFMWRMGILARDLLTQAEGNRHKILDSSRWKGRSLTRLLDNYNYTKFTLKRE